MEDFLNTAHWLLIVLLAIPVVIIALLINIIIKLVKMDKKREE